MVGVKRGGLIVGVGVLVLVLVCVVVEWIVEQEG